MRRNFLKSIGFHDANRKRVSTYHPAKKPGKNRKIMFIRKREKKLKNGKVSVTYQAVKSYRQGKKVKQDVINLGKSSDVREVLKEELRFLERMRKDLEVPISAYLEARWRTGLGLVVVAVPLKEAEKRRNKLLEQYKKQGRRVAKLESLASRLR